MNVPNAVFWWLAVVQPQALAVVGAALAAEMFGYGFGFVGVILFIMQVVAPGRYTTAHYALGTGVMQLGLVLFKTLSGDIQTALGYERFFLWVLLCAIPVIVVSRFLTIGAKHESAPIPIQSIHTKHSPSSCRGDDVRPIKTGS